MRERERRARAALWVGVVVALLVVGVAVYLGTTISQNATAPPVSRAGLTPAPRATSSPDLSGLAEAMNSTMTGAPPPSPSTTPPPTHTSTALVGSVPPKLAPAVSSCRKQWQLSQTALSAADRSLAQWRAHLQIMNDLQAGRINLATAKARWPYTTYQAGDNVVAFRSADAAVTAYPSACAVDDSVTGRTAREIRACAASMETLGRALARARTAIAPWERHIKDQTHFAMGMMTAPAAEAAWRVMWKKGLETLPAYDAAATDARAATCPLAD
ncbi:hypothetical protein [Terrabacter sp. NPDC080008]|uniref:hypothetical protein n=1 Tax=Terrabacter sp. NPDC080008 TaxID=3155176 RepID=UPI00344D14C3